jgi:hypothetical protein
MRRGYGAADDVMQAACKRRTCRRDITKILCFGNRRRSTLRRLMGDVVNLKRYKKRIAREQAAKNAQAQRARFGRTKAERQQDQEQNRKFNSALDHHQLGEDQT